MSSGTSDAIVQAAKLPQSYRLYDCQASTHGISRSRDQDRPAMQVASPLSHPLRALTSTRGEHYPLGNCHS